jgi:hypothetical protein
MQTGTLVDQFLNTPQSIHIQRVMSDAVECVRRAQVGS